MPHLTLFYAPHTCALATRIALNEAGADYQLQYVDFSQNAQRSGEYLALNPLGRVPALRLEDGSTVLTETVALLAYVAQRFPDAHLAPPTRCSSPACRAFTATWPAPCMWPTPTAGAAHAGATIPRPSPPCRTRSPPTWRSAVR
jgi:glutathione S-transferase